MAAHSTSVEITEVFTRYTVLASAFIASIYQPHHHLSLDHAAPHSNREITQILTAHVE